MSPLEVSTLHMAKSCVEGLALDAWLEVLHGASLLHVLHH